MLIKHEQLTEQIIKGFYTVYRALGYGYGCCKVEAVTVIARHRRWRSNLQVTEREIASSLRSSQ